MLFCDVDADGIADSHPSQTPHLPRKGCLIDIRSLPILTSFVCSVGSLRRLQVWSSNVAKRLSWTNHCQTLLSSLSLRIMTMLLRSHTFTHFLATAFSLFTHHSTVHQSRIQFEQHGVNASRPSQQSLAGSASDQ